MEREREKKKKRERKRKERSERVNRVVLSSLQSREKRE